MRTGPDAYDRGTRSWLAAILLAARYDGLEVTAELFDGVAYEPSTALALISAQRRHDVVAVPGTVAGNLRVDSKVAGDLVVHGSVAGYLAVEGAVAGDVLVNGTVARYVAVYDAVAGDLHVAGTVTEDLAVAGAVAGGVIVSGTTRRLVVVQRGVVAGDLRVDGIVSGDVLMTGTVDRDLTVAGTVAGGVSVSGKARRLVVVGTVSGDVSVSGKAGDLVVAGSGTVTGDLVVVGSGTVTGDVLVEGAVAGDLAVHGKVNGDLTIGGTVAGDVALLGEAARLRVVGRFGGRVRLAPKGLLAFVSLRGAQFADEVFVGDRVRIDHCDFRQCADLDRLHLVGADLFPAGKGRGVPKLATKFPTDGEDDEVLAHEMASIYRQLRSNFEDRKNRAASGVFYRGEMDARLAAAKERGWNVERVVLGAYRLLSLYGQSIWRPAAWFVLVAAAGAGLFAIGGLDLAPNHRRVDASVMETFTFATRSMLGFFSPPEGDLSTGEQWVQIALRFCGPVLLTQMVLAVRERVAR